MTKYTKEQVLAVLEPATVPITTADILCRCRDNAGCAPYGGGSAKNYEVREALDALVAAGTVVSAKYIPYYGKAALIRNPYQFIATGKTGELSWMTKVAADEYREQLDRQRREYEASFEPATSIKAALPDVEVSTYENGTFKIIGNLGDLQQIAKALGMGS